MQRVYCAQPADVAIVGMSVLLPGAQSHEEYWAGILNKTNRITEIPARRWDWRLYFDEDRTARDKVYSKWGGFLEEISFDPTSFGIPPASVKSIEPMQLLALEATRRALRDAGYESGGFDRKRTSVIFGASGGMGDLGQQLAARSELPRMLGTVPAAALDRLPEWSEESFPGVLFNVVTGRIANRFDLGGSNYTVDAACASSLAALDQAVRELETGVCDVALAGGVDTMQSAFGYLCFSKTQALSPNGVARIFDERADGIVLSEGVGVLVLKRLSDARRDNDRVYAVVKATGSSSDGRGSSLTSPTSEGQMRAMRRAYEKAGFSPSTVGLYEAHGTGTAVGDATELNSFRGLLAEAGAEPNACVVGSVKALIGHTKACAGVAGVVKAALALHYKVLPPHAGIEKPLPGLTESETPVCVVEEAIPWIAKPVHARRAAVSAFGFGGTNSHVVLEESGGDGRAEWPCELFTWKATSRDQLLDLLQDVCSWHGARSFGDEGAVALAIVAESHDDLARSMAAVANALKAGGEIPASPNVFFSEIGTPAGKVAFLFPGQGSQYPSPAREAALFIDEIRFAVEEADRILGERLSHSMYRPQSFLGTENSPGVSDTRVAQPLIGTISCGFLDFLKRIGISPELVGGHSYGEFTALHAAGVIGRRELLEISVLRGKTMHSACEAAPGAMAAVMASRDRITAILDGTSVRIANHNSPRQCVITGGRDEVAQVLQKLTAADIASKLLPVAGAFHSPLMRSAQTPLTHAISGMEMNAPQCCVYSNTTGGEHSTRAEEIRETLKEHLLSSVEFVSEIEAMYANGARVFVEVGPRTVLTSLAQEILKDRSDAICVGVDGGNGSLRWLLRALGRLHVAGIDFDRTLGRSSIDFPNASGLGSPAGRRSAGIWLLDGGGVRRPEEKSGQFNRAVALTSEDEPTPQNSMSTEPKQPTPSAPNEQVVALHAYSAYQETMRQFLKVQEQVMAQFLGGAPQSSHAAAPMPLPLPTIAVAHEPVSPVQTVVEKAPSSGGMNREAITNSLLGLVSERTGYPTDMLGLDQDVEADLGIDSIKRVEIFSAFQKQLPGEVVERLSGNKSAITRIRTLKGWIDAVMSEAA